jgi:hypothetical protein
MIGVVSKIAKGHSVSTEEIEEIIVGLALRDIRQ